jgi:hypothetical protein
MSGAIAGALILTLFGNAPAVASAAGVQHVPPALRARCPQLAQDSRDHPQTDIRETTDSGHSGQEETIYPLLPTRSCKDPDHPAPAWMDELASVKPRIVALGRFGQLPLSMQLEFAAFMKRSTHPSDVEWEREAIRYAGPALRSTLVNLINGERSEGFVLTYLDIVRDAAKSSLIADPRSFRSAIAGRLGALQKGWARSLAEQTLAEISRQ